MHLALRRHFRSQLGLPATNWKKRTGVTIAGTLADCIWRRIILAIDALVRGKPLPDDDSMH